MIAIVLGTLGVLFAFMIFAIIHATANDPTHNLIDEDEAQIAAIEEYRRKRAEKQARKMAKRKAKHN